MKYIKILFLVFYCSATYVNASVNLVPLKAFPEYSSVKDSLNDDQNIHIYWDTSLSMQFRDLKKEYEYLDKIFAQNKNCKVTLIKFNQSVLSKNDYTIEQGKWEALKEELSNTIYDGATSYNWAKDISGTASVFVFSDGIYNWDNDLLAERKITLVNSIRNKGIDLELKYNQLNVVQLADINISLEKNSTKSKNDKQRIKGFVYVNNKTLAGATVQIKNTKIGTITDENGNYEISGSIGDTLVFSYLGKGISEKAFEGNLEINAELDASAIQLEEVTVKGTQTEAELVTTGYGEKNKKQLGYAVSTVSSNDFYDTETTVGKALDGKVSGLNVGPGSTTGGDISQGDLSKATIRGLSSFFLSNHPLIVLDGVPLDRSEPSSFLSGGSNSFYDFVDPNNIHEVTILKGLAAANRYGSLGNNGVILITTKTAYTGGTTVKKSKKPTPEYVDLMAKKESVYITDIKKETQPEAQYDVYLAYRSIFGNSPEFYVTVHDYFKTSFPEKAQDVLMNLLELYSDSPKIMRVLAYKLEEEGDFEAANQVYQHIFNLEPLKVQPFLELASINEILKKPKKAYAYLSDLRNDKTHNHFGLKKMLVNHIRYYVNNHSELKNDTTIPEFFKSGAAYPARIICEWNDPDAEFEIQFIDSKKNYSTWSHSKQEIQSFMEYKQIGLLSQEYIIDETFKGEWIVNMNYIGNTSLMPTYFKIKIIYNFGKPSEYSEIKFLNISEKNVNQNILKLTVN